MLLAEDGQTEEALRQAAGALEACGGQQQQGADVAVTIFDPQFDGGGAPQGLEQQNQRREQLTTLCLVLLGQLMSSRYPFDARLLYTSDVLLYTSDAYHLRRFYQMAWASGHL